MQKSMSMFGDIVKVTPSSKVVGDMALMMVTGNLTVADILDPAREINFPESVVSLFKGEIGQPPGGFPQALQKKILKGDAPLTQRPGAVMPLADFSSVRVTAETECGRSLTDDEFASYLMYPAVFTEFAARASGLFRPYRIADQCFFLRLAAQ